MVHEKIEIILCKNFKFLAKTGGRVSRDEFESASPSEKSHV